MTPAQRVERYKDRWNNSPSPSHPINVYQGEALYATDLEALLSERKDMLEALKAALNFIKESPSDPDITHDQTIAWLRLTSLDVDKIVERAEGKENER